MFSVVPQCFSELTGGNSPQTRFDDGSYREVHIEKFTHMVARPRLAIRRNSALAIILKCD
jgi:hypothetical protein